MATPNNRIKVMQIIARMNVGGPAVIVAQLMRGLDSERFEQILVTGYCDGNEADYLEEVATDIQAVRIAGLGRSISLQDDLRAFLDLIKLIKQFNPDVIHTHTAKAGVLGRLASLLAGKRAVRVHTFHGHLLHGYFSKGKVQIVIEIEKAFAKTTKVLISIGTKVRDDLLNAGIGSANQFRVFFPGLPTPRSFNKAELRTKLNLEAETIYCTYVGRLTQIKRPDRLLDVAAAVKASGSKIHFLVAGEGELFETSKGRALTENLPVTFLGWRNDIEEILAASDIAILTSDNEGIPLTLIQAAFAALPIVSTDVGSISDIVIDQSNGYLVDANDEALAESLEKLERDPQLRELMGKAGRERAAQKFSLTGMLKDHSDLYQGIHNL